MKEFKNVRDRLAKNILELDGIVATEPIRNIRGSATSRSILFRVSITWPRTLYEEEVRCVGYGEFAYKLRELKRGDTFYALVRPIDKSNYTEYEIVKLPAN